MSISLLSWSGWIAVTAITILYAIYVVKSYLFATVATMNVMAQATVLFYGLHARLGKRRTALPGRTAPIAGTAAYPIESAIEAGGASR